MSGPRAARLRPCDDSPHVTYSGGPYPQSTPPAVDAVPIPPHRRAPAPDGDHLGHELLRRQRRVRRAPSPGVQCHPPDDRFGRVPGDHRRDAMASTAVFGAGRIARQHLLHAGRDHGARLAGAGRSRCRGALPVSGHLRCRPGADERREQLAHDRGDAGASSRSSRPRLARTGSVPCIGPGPRSR